jgi:tripartite-type tricarboxylate transporter receptor subunit TctC
MRLIAALLFVVVTLPAQAQYPDRAVRIVVPFPAGGPTDILTRVVAQQVAARWSHPVVVDNKPGAGGAIGADLVAKSPPDGYVLLMGTSSTHSVGPALQKLPYDTEKDFTPLVNVGAAANVLIVSPSLEASDVRSLIALAKAKPGELNYASSGNGTVTHLSGELFKLLAGVDLQHVPYKGTGPAIPDIARGQVALIFDSIITGLQHAKSGNVRILAVCTEQRSSLLPDVPTMAQAGLPGYESSAWFGLFGPAAMAPAVVAKINADVAAALNVPDVRERFAAAGAETVGGTPQAFAGRIRAEREKWTRVVEAAGIR